MRAGLVLALVALALPLALGGCASKGPGDGDAAGGADRPPSVREETLRDNLTARLHPASGPFFPTLWIEDVVELPDGGNISLALGLGVRCEGNATSVAPEGSIGWVTCFLRLVSDPLAMSESSRRLELGFDYQPLTPRTPVEPVEWRVVVEVEEINATETGGWRTAFDSGWRPVDFSPRVTAPTVTLDIVDPCDAPDETEANPAGDDFDRGLVLMNVSFTVESHAKVTLDIGVADSVVAEVPNGWPPAADLDVTAHAVRVVYDEWGSEQAMWVLLPVDLETDASPGLVGSGPCTFAVAHEEQLWTVVLTYVGADGKGGSFGLEVPVDVYLAVPADP